MHETATRTFEDNLQSPAGAEAREYLKKRGLLLRTRFGNFGWASPRAGEINWFSV